MRQIFTGRLDNMGADGPSSILGRARNFSREGREKGEDGCDVTPSPPPSPPRESEVPQAVPLPPPSPPALNLPDTSPKLLYNPCLPTLITAGLLHFGSSEIFELFSKAAPFKVHYSNLPWI